MEEKCCEFEVDNFCTAFVCFSGQKCFAKGSSGEPLYSEYQSRDDVKLPGEADAQTMKTGDTKLRVINVLDKNMVGDYIRTADGATTLINMVRGTGDMGK